MKASPPVLAIPGLAPELAARVQDGLTRVDDLILATVDHDDPLVAQASAHLAEAGGKRFRPLLTLLASELGTGVSDEVVAAGGRGRADPPRVALPRRRHGRGRGAPRRAQRQREVRQLDGDPRRRPPLRQGVRAGRGAGGRGGPHPGAGVRAALRRADPRRPPLPAGPGPGRCTTSACSTTRPVRSSRPRRATARCSAAAPRTSSS